MSVLHLYDSVYMFGMLQEVLVWDLWVDGIPGAPYNLLFTVASIA